MKDFLAQGGEFHIHQADITDCFIKDTATSPTTMKLHPHVDSDG